MKKYIIYGFLGVLCVALYFMTRGQQSETMLFYGFSENKEKEINFDYDVKVIDILVNSGQSVKKGDPMIKVIRTSNPLKFSAINNDIAQLEVKKSLHESTVRSEINALQARRQGEISKIESEIHQLKIEDEKNRILLNILDSARTYESSSALKSKMQQLETEKTAISREIDAEINVLSQELKGSNTYDIEMQKLLEEKAYYAEQEKNHTLKAPEDGIVGFINCSPGENYSSFSKLFSLYDPHPQTVKAYILESMITSIKIDDEVKVTSFLNSEYSYKGKVTGFGTRILEIPSRLSKVPELKMYGREVIISLPVENKLLQKEKVRVELVNENAGFLERLTNR